MQPSTIDGYRLAIADRLAILFSTSLELIILIDS